MLTVIYSLYIPWVSSGELCTFETIFGQMTSQNAINKYETVPDVPQKVLKKRAAIALAGI